MDKIPLEKNSLPLVVIFGRTNVGKSALFNCLAEKKQALVSAMTETTRDSNLGEISWRGRNFVLVDTGGLIDLKHLTRPINPLRHGPRLAGAFGVARAGEASGQTGQTKLTDDIGAQVQRQAFTYLKQADLVLFLLDNKSGLLPQDKALALLIKKNIDADKVILTVNKVDAPKDRLKISEFYKLSFGEPCLVSAANGSGTGDLLDIIVEKLNSRISQLVTRNSNTGNNSSNNDGAEGLQDTSCEIRVCIIGQPNVGKSSLLNALLGYERVIVSPAPHTTREPQHTKIIYQDQPLLLIDTAGISHKGAKIQGWQKFGIAKSLSALAKSDLALLVLDISQPLTHQDARLVEEIVKRKKSFIFIANKWDRIAKRDTKKYSDYIYDKMPFARFAPSQFISAKTGEKVKKIFDLILKIDRQRKLELSDSQLSHFLSRIVKVHRPAKGKGVRHPRVRGFTQLETNPPKFEIKIGPKEDLHFSYIRFIENRLRETYGFLGTPLLIIVAKSRTAHGLHRD
ncbi:ribosome biogenesis GTPase Der [Candidatus Falkowbacteria bacterium RIFCSPLOWO2_02_FULL_45_21]|uniref:GTPase Der n=1 Tax=Candidatus Falkowbacteria bacterium RIFCSPLOWO2_02_FULL_45_21 TaxID=1797989 RepID=A0A1F5SCQ4_9BACT|nr:MAG: ribosome biogenesis GTPase Der [Candidatus Falkowbacteria bacterium RIFCSPLOWO2_02_FULL_45_21]